MANSSANHDEDLETHRETWNNFVKLVIYSVIAIAGVLAWMALFLT